MFLIKVYSLNVINIFWVDFMVKGLIREEVLDKVRDI